MLQRRAALALALLGSGAWLAPQQVSASQLPAFADQAWQAIGGGPADLYFPDLFEGVWGVTCTLSSVETPLGEEEVPDMRVVQRARKEDLGAPQRYLAAFVRNKSGYLVFDRRFNTAQLLGSYYGDPADFINRIDWERDNPNILYLRLPQGTSVRTRVTRRSANPSGPQRLETSEYVESVYEGGDSEKVRLKASQCFTKYHWRTQEQAAQDGGPTIVATQVLSDYLTVYDGEERYLRAMNRPVVQYTYKLAFSRQPDVAAVPSVVAT